MAHQIIQVILDGTTRITFLAWLRLQAPASFPVFFSFDPKQFWDGKQTKNNLGKHYRLKAKDQARNNDTTA